MLGLYRERISRGENQVSKVVNQPSRALSVRTCWNKDITPEKLAQVLLKEENKKRLDFIEDFMDAAMLFFFDDCVGQAHSDSRLHGLLPSPASCHLGALTGIL